MKQQQFTDDLQAFREIASRLARDVEQRPPQERAVLEAAALEVHRLYEQIRNPYRGAVAPVLVVDSRDAVLSPNLAQTITDSITDGLILIDRDWRIQFINERAAQNGFFNPADLTGRNLWETFPQLLDTPLEAHYRQVMDARQPAHFYMKGVIRDQWYLISVYPSDLGITVYWLDYTSQKVTEYELEQLLQENQRHKALLDSIFQADPSGLAVVVGPELRFAFTNPVFRMLCPNPRQAVPGGQLEAAWPASEGNEYHSQVARVLETGKPFQIVGLERAFPKGGSRTFTLQARRIQWDGQHAALLIFWDVTEAARAQAALRESLERLNRSQEIAHLGSWELDLGEDRLTWSDEVYRIFGLAPQAFGASYQAFLERVHPDDRAAVDAAYAGSIEKGQDSYEIEHRVVRADTGAVRYVHEKCEHRRDASGRIVRSIGMVHDITDRKQAEETRKRSKTLLAQAGQMAHLGAWELVISNLENLNDNPLYWSDEVYRIFGFEPGSVEVSNELFLQGVHPDDHARVLDSVSRAITERRPYRVEHRVLRPDGTERMVLEHAEIQFDEAGKPLQMVGAVQDITELKQAEEALRLSEEKYRTLFESIDEGFCVIQVLFDDKDQPVDYIFLEVNPAFEQQTGIKNAAGRRMRDIAPRHEDYWFEIYGHIARTGESRRFENQARQLADRVYEVYAFRAGKPDERKVAILFNDIAERKRTEDALRASEARFRTSVDSLLDGFAIYSAVREPDHGRIVDFRYEYINPAGCRMNRRSKEETVGRTLLELLPAHRETGIFNEYVRVVETGDPFQRENLVYEDTFGGQRIRRVFDHQAVKMGDGFALAWREVSDRVRAQQALEASEARFRLALAGAPISVASLDRDLRYVWVYQPQGGIPPEQMLGKRDDELMPVEDVAELMALKRSVIVTGRGVQRELHLQTARGWRHFIYHLEPIRDAAGEVSGIRSAVMDLTDQRVLEQEVGEHLTRVEVQRRLIEQREQERLQIARDLHDGPIQELLGVNYSLQSLLATLQGRSEADEVQRIQAAVQSQVNDLRTFASELRPPLLAKFGLGKAIQAHATAFQAKLPGLQLHLQVEEESPPLPEPVCLPLYRIFQEAANNILKHSQAKDVWVRFKVMDRLVVLEVRDNGVGFDLPGQWLDLARQGHLGLVGMQERAEAVGGIVNIMSRRNQGTTVQVSVPLFNGEARLVGEEP